MTKHNESYEIHKTIDELLCNKLFKEVDFILEHLDIKSFNFLDPIDVSLSLLVATLPAKKLLTNRQKYVSLIRELADPHEVSGLLSGLE